MENFDFKKSLGQNFLIDNNIINKIVDSIKPNKDDLIIEIGPGSGALTKELIKYNNKVICFEIDERLRTHLGKINGDNLEVVFSDFLKIDLNAFLKNYKYNRLLFVGNLPYYITTAIINKIVDESDVNEITIMIQKEVANRITASPSTREYGSLSVFLQYNFNIIKVVDVSKNCFCPKPKVDSSVIKLVRKQKECEDEKVLYKLIKDSFMHKRKNLRNNLLKYDLEKISKALEKKNKNLQCRAEELSVQDFIDISNELVDR